MNHHYNSITVHLPNKIQINVGFNSTGPPPKVSNISRMNAAQTAAHENRQEGTSCITAAVNITTEICSLQTEGGFSSMLLEPLKKMNQHKFYRWVANFRNFNTSLPVGDIRTIHGWASRPRLLQDQEEHLP